MALCLCRLPSLAKSPFALWLDGPLVDLKLDGPGSILHNTYFSVETSNSEERATKNAYCHITCCGFRASCWREGLGFRVLAVLRVFAGPGSGLLWAWGLILWELSIRSKKKLKIVPEHESSKMLEGQTKQTQELKVEG